MEFAIELQAQNPASNCFRAYHVTVEQDLLGDWLVDVSFGRIGSVGLRQRYVVPDCEGARDQLTSCLKRRLSAPRRIGVPYRCTRLHDPHAWIEPDWGFGNTHSS